MTETPKYPVVVAVGTDKHPFNRLICWVDEWASTHPDVGVFIQHGSSSRPRHAAGADLLPHEELLAMIAEATVLISHGGPSTVMDMRTQGRMPIVLGRNPKFGEHIDAHQMRFANHLHSHQMALCVSDQSSLHRQIDRGLANPVSLQLRTDGDPVPSGVKAFADHMNTLLNIPVKAHERHINV